MIKKKLLFKLIFILSIGISGCSNDAEDGDYFKKGVVLYEQGEYDRARLEIKNAIKKNPGNAEAFYYLALLNEKGRKFKAMKSDLLKSIKLDPDNIDVRLKLSKVYILFNELDLALDEVKIVLIKDPGQLDALSLNASILVRQGEVAEALTIIDEVLQKDPNHIDALSLKVVLLMKDESFDEAASILIAAIQRDEENISLYLLKIQLDNKRNDVNELVKDYEKLLELKSDDVYVKYALSKAYLKANERQKAEKILTQLVNDSPDLIDAKLALLDFYYMADVDKAEKQLNIFIDQTGDNYGVVIKIANWLIGKGRADRAVEILKTVVSQENISQKDKATINLILAKIEISNKRFEQGSVYIEKILTGDPSNFDAKLLKAEVFFANGSYDDSKVLVEEMLWQKPKMDLAISLLGRINLIQGNLDKADANFKDALKINPVNSSALKFIVAKSISEEHVDYGIEVLERALRYSPVKVPLLIKLIELNIDEENWDKANQYINIIKQQNNGQLYGQFFKAKIFQKQNKSQEAVVIYKEILKKYPSLKDALVGMAESYSVLNQQLVMIDYLNEVVENNPNIIFPYILKSQLLSLDKQNVKAVKLLENFLTAQKINHAQVYIELARQYAILGNKEAEYTTYIKALNYNPEDIDLLLRLASFYEKDSQFTQAVDEYEKIIQLNPRQNVARNNLASILIDHYGKPEDLERVVLLTETFKQSKQPYFLDTYGWSQLKNGNIDKAFKVFKKVVLLDPDVSVFRYHLAVAYSMQGDDMAAELELKQALYLGKGKAFPEKALIEKMLVKIKK